MNFKELMEGAEPKMPGAPGGIQIMTPQQFVAKAGDMPGEEPEEGVAEGSAADGSVNYTLGHTPDAEYVYSIYRDGKKEGTYHSVDQAKRIVANMKKSAPYIKYKITRSPRSKMAGPKGQLPEQGVAEGGEKDRQWSNKDMERLRVATRDFDDIMASDGPDQTKHDLIKKRIQTRPMAGPKGVLPEQGVAEGSNDTIYPNAEVIKLRNGRPIGEIYQDENGWGFFHYGMDGGNDFIDSREDAIEGLRDLHQETGRSRRDTMEQGVAEGFPKDPNAPKLVRDRKTGKQYDPNKEFEKKMTSPEVMAQMKRMAQKEGVEDRTSYQVAKILTDRGIKYDPAQENELINAIGMVLVKELNMTPKEARNLISYDEDFVADTLGELRSMEQSVSEVAPPGWEKTVKAMKKHDEIDNPFALAWSMKNKGYKSHKKESADPYFESLADKLDQLKKK